MWIRSQDRKVLTKIDDLDIDGANQIWGDCSLLGKYSSQEKALRVFDEIQDELESEEFNITDLPDVFEMPQDWEVEIWFQKR